MNALLRIAAAVLVAVLFVPLRFLIRLFVRRAVEGAKKTVQTALLPDRIQLVSEPRLRWQDRPALFRLERELRDAGFRLIGLYRIAEIEGVQLAALAHPEDGTCAVVYESAAEGVWLDLYARFPDGTSVTASNKPVPGRLASRPGAKKLHRKGASVARLLARLRSEIGKRELERIDAARFGAVFEEDYASEAAWQKGEGPHAARKPEGPQPEEVARDDAADRACAPLFEAIEARDVARVRELAGSAPLEGRDAKGLTPLMAAAAAGDLALAEALLEAGADPSAQAVTGGGDGNPLERAVENVRDPDAAEFMQGFATVVKALGGGGLDDTEWVTPLGLAVESGSGELVGRLAAAGASLSGPDGEPMLHRAARLGDADVTRALLEAGAELNAPAEGGETALAVAASNGWLDVVRILLDAGADPDVKDADGQSAIVLAAEDGFREIVELLAPRVKGRQARQATRALDEFEAEQGPRVFDPLAKRLWEAASDGKAAMVRKLLALGVAADATEPDEVDEDEPGGAVTPLMLATQGGHLDVMQLLIEAGADVNHRGGGDTPLVRALSPMFMDRSLQDPVVRLLVRCGADVNQPDADGNPPLIRALCDGSGDPAGLRLLLALGADANATGEDGETALAIAERGEDAEMLEILRSV